MRKATCPVCGTGGIQVKKDGSLYRHDGKDESPCPGSGGPPAAGHEPAAGQQEPAGTGDAAAGPAPAGSETSVYRWTLTVCRPLLYLDDAAWHQANGLAAAEAARQTGYTVTGEARWSGDTTAAAGGQVQLTYLVPVEAS